MKIMACLQVALTSIILCVEPYSDWTENKLPEYQKSNHDLLVISSEKIKVTSFALNNRKK